MGTLAKSNKHLSSAAKRKASVFVTVSTSSAIEGIRAPFKSMKANGAQARETPKPAKKDPFKR
jgi:hypothetical protein